MDSGRLAGEAMLHAQVTFAVAEVNPAERKPRCPRVTSTVVVVNPDERTSGAGCVARVDPAGAGDPATPT